MSLHRVFLIFFISFLVGVFVGNIFPHFYEFTFLSSIFLMFVGLIIYFARKHHFFVFLFVCGWYLGYGYAAWNEYGLCKIRQQVSYYENQTVSLQAQVVDVYKVSENDRIYQMRSESLLKGVGFLITVPKNFVFQKNDRVDFQGKIIKKENMPGGFNYVRFLESKGIFFHMVFPQNISVTPGKLNWGEVYLSSLRLKILTSIQALYPPEHASLLGGLLIGAKENFSTSLQQNFNISGLSHIISVSGFNIAILILFFGFVFGYFPLYLRAFLITLGVVAFVVLVGGGVAVIRAALMGLIGYYILLSGRKADATMILFFTAFVMVVYNPLTLNYDVSFHLSFLAVMGLLYCRGFWEKIFGFLPSFFSVKESFLLTLSALTATFPIMLFQFGQFALYAPFANAMVGGLIPFTMFFGFISVFLNALSPTLGFYAGYITYFLLEFILQIADFFAHLPYAVFKIDAGLFAPYVEILVFGFFFFLLLYFYQKESPKQ